MDAENTYRRSVRTTEIDPQFDENGYAKDWHFAVPEAFKDCLDIRLTERVENKRSVLRETQGPFYCFSEGYRIYDTPRAYEVWSEALKHIKRYCVIISAIPNHINDKRFVNGQVQFQLYRPNDAKDGVELIDTFRLSQNDFVEFLRTGEIEYNKLLTIQHDESSQALAN
jgi:hypothetical protein